LERRLAARTLDQAMIDRVVRRLLALQGDPKQPWWDPGWWDFVEQAKGLNLIQDADWKRYAKQAATRSVGLKVRPTVRRGEPLPLQLRGWGLLSPEQSRFLGRCSIVGLHFDDAGEIKTSLNGLRMNVGGGEISAKAPATLLAALEEGPHTLHLTMKIDVFTGAMDAAPPTVSCEVKRAASFMLVSADTPALLPLIVPSLQPAVQARLHVFRVDNGTARLTVQIHVDHMPVDLAYDVWVRTDKEQWKLASFNYAKRANEATLTLQDANGHGIPPHFDVILKPSAAIAEGTVNLTSYWDHEMVFKDVSTEDARPQSATRPISRRPSQPAAIRPVLERRAW
jgi:hypothetical protein